MNTSNHNPNWTDDDATPLWRILLDPRGRINRRTFWLFGVLTLMGLGLLAHVLLAIARVPEQGAANVVNAFLLWPAIATNAKRWHDSGRSGWWSLVALVPVVGALAMLAYNGLVKGTVGVNRFGDAPRDHSAGQLLT